MAFGFLQSRSTVGADPLALAYNGAVTPGSLLIAAVFWDQNTQTCSVSDPTNGTWTAIGSPTTGAGSLAGFRRQMFWKLNTASTAITVTADCSGTGASDGLAIHEYSYGATPSIDGTPVYDNVSSSTPTTSAIITTQNADLLFAMDTVTGSVSSAGTGYVLRETFDGTNGTEDDLDGGTAGSKTASFNTAGGDNMLGFVAFKDTSAVVTPTANDPPIGLIGRGAGW